MSVSMKINTMSHSLDMYEEPDPSSAYSLSGHVAIAVTSPYCLFERRRTARLLLQSVTLTFEGQSEVITPQIGYSSLRLCSTTREIAPADPVELSNEGHEDSDEPCIWNIVFSLPIPGWLPATTKYGIEDTGIRYALYAEAKYINLDDGPTNTWSFATLCSPFRSRVKSVEVHREIVLRRFILPSPEASNGLTYLVNSLGPPQPTSDKPRIPTEILSKIQVLTSVSEHVDIDDDSLPLTIRMRTKDLETSVCQRLQVSSVAVDILQKEKCRYHPSSEYLARYPVPPNSRQPPNEPLRDAHPLGTIYDMGLHMPSCLDEVSRSFSLLPSSETGTYSLGQNNYAFANDAVPAEVPTWYTLETSVPFVHRAPSDRTRGWAGICAIRPTSSSPLISIRHEVSISLTCTYDTPDSDEQAIERLNFCVPIRFAHFAPTQPPQNIVPAPACSLAPTSSVDTPISPSLPSLIPYAQSLPAYSQLYDYNGDRKIDYSIPLPLYTPRSSASSSSSTLEFDAEGKIPDDINQLHRDILS